MNKEKMIPFKDRICELMVERKITQVDIANKLGYSPQAISKWCNGKSSPSLGDLSDIADKLGVSVFWLAGYPNIPMNDGNAMDKEMKELFTQKLSDQQIMDAAPRMEVNGSTVPVYTEHQLTKRMEMLSQAFDMFLEKKITEDTLKLIINSLR